MEASDGDSTETQAAIVQVLSLTSAKFARRIYRVLVLKVTLPHKN